MDDIENEHNSKNTAGSSIENKNDNNRKSTVYRTIKTYVLRQGRMTSAQQRDYNELSKIWCIPFSENKLEIPNFVLSANDII